MQQIRTGDLLKARFNTFTFNRDGLKLVKNSYYKLKDISIKSSGDVVFHMCVEGGYVDEYDLKDLRKTFALDDEFDETEIGGPREIIVSSSDCPKMLPSLDHLTDKISTHNDIVSNIHNELRQIEEFLTTIRDEINPTW